MKRSVILVAAIAILVNAACSPALNPPIPTQPAAATPLLVPAVSTNPPPNHPSTDRATPARGNDDRTLTVHMGENFSLDLDAGYLWNFTIDNPAIVTRTVDSATGKPTLDQFNARQSGTATITASGDLPCRQSKPPCMAPTRMIQTKIIVQ